MAARRVFMVIAVALLGLVSAAVTVDSDPAVANPADARAADARSDPVAAPLLIHTSSGTVIVRGVPGADVQATTFAGGVQRTRANGVVGTDGTASLVVGRFDGRSGGLHPGDVVRVETAGSRREQRVSLAGYLDEVTGVFTGWTVPRAKVTLRVYTRGSRAVLAGEVREIADGRGQVEVDLASKVTPPPSGTASPWRGFAADLFAETAPGQVLSRVVQTTNATIVATIGQVSASYLPPGSMASFELRRAGVVAERLEAVADRAGLAQADVVTEVEQEDVLVVRWLDLGGAPRSLELTPFALEADTDVAAGTITGATAPGAKVVAIYDAPEGETRGKATAGPDGRFQISLPGLVGDRRVILWRVSDPGATGVGVDRLHLRTPAVRVDASRGAISGWAQHGRQTVAIQLWRGTTELESRPAITERPGRFQARLRTPLLPGDEVRVVPASGRVLALVTPAHPVVLAGSARTPRGTGEPGWALDITTARCSATTIVGADSGWRIELPCGAPGDLAQVRQVRRSGASAGSSTSTFLALP